MFTAQQDNVKTAEIGGFLATSRPPGEEGEFGNLERARTTLDENKQWLTRNGDKVLLASQYEIVPNSAYDRNQRVVLVKEDEYVLRCLGAAVMMRWGTLPAKLQRELFDHASSLGEFDHHSSISPPEQTARLKGLIARFLHNHNRSPTK